MKLFEVAASAGMTSSCMPGTGRFSCSLEHTYVPVVAVILYVLSILIVMLCR